MKYQLTVFLVVAGTCFTLPQGQPDPVFALIEASGFNNEASQQDLLESMKPARIPQTVDCLLNTPGITCDPRIGSLRRVIETLSRNNYKCDSCPLELRFFIVYVQQAMKAIPEYCIKLEKGLKLRPLCSV
ncbi:hypothetical protein SK128_014994 [Halocaridina rubra]|uniref:Uncharacterized protein n=1 Tax=Halocaridina rubra TaxID=373956 RepID=A0AAN8X8A4_HALRR